MKILGLIVMLEVGQAVALVTVSPNPLAGLPGQPGAHAAQIQALGDNQWLNLGAPAADPVYGRARGCSWGGKSMVFAPDRRGAFRTGEGWHAYVKPDGFGQDDYWFYDINGHRWICVYPGTDVRHLKQDVIDSVIRVDANGQPVDRGGQPIPAHLLIHAFGYIGYDTDLKKFSMHRGGGFGRYYMPGIQYSDSLQAYYGDVHDAIAMMETQGLNKSGPRFAPWAYNTQTGKFERELAVNSSPDVGGYYPMYLYVPSKKAFFSGGQWGIAFYTPATRTWGPLLPNTGSPAGEWSLACYDSKRDRIYGGRSLDDFYCYDVQSQVLTKIANSSGVSATLDNNQSALVYDSINDRVLLFAFWNSNSILPFDPAANAWGQRLSFEATFASSRQETNAAFYDPALGVVFLYTAGDSYDNGVMWAYRYKRSASAVEGRKPATDRALPALAASPNPLAGNTGIRLPAGAWKAYNLRGEQVADLSGRTVWNAGNCPAGIYLLKTRVNGRTLVHKLVIQK